LMQGGIHPDLKIDWFERLFTGIKQRFRRFGCTAFPLPKCSQSPNTPSSTCALRSRGSGMPLDSIPGGGAEILDDDVRKRIARLKCRTEDWLASTAQRTNSACAPRRR